MHCFMHICVSAGEGAMNDIVFYFHVIIVIRINKWTVSTVLVPVVYGFTSGTVRPTHSRFPAGHWADMDTLQLHASISLKMPNIVSDYDKFEKSLNKVQSKLDLMRNDGVY